MLASRDGLDTELVTEGEAYPHLICSGSSGCQGPVHKDFHAAVPL